MSRERDALPIEELVADCLERMDAHGPDALEQCCADHPEQAVELRERVELLARAGLSPGSTDSSDFPERLGDFRLEARLGAGGMGVVYRATQVSLGRPVALKLIHPTELYFPGARERFRREVETVALLQHPNVVPIHAVGEERGIPFFAMELVDGASLADVLDGVRDRPASELSGDDVARVLSARAGAAVTAAPSPIWRGTWIDTALRIAREAAEALEYVHRRGVIHRDIKPSNIMVTRGGRILLVDFGLARGSADLKITRTGAQLGSLPYMAPELVAGGATELDERTDVYALGAVLYELVARSRAFEGDDIGEMRAAISAGAVRPLHLLHPGAGKALETVVAKAMAVEPARRYASASEFARDLDNLLQRRPIEARRAGIVERLRLWVARRPAEATAAALGVVLVAGVPSVVAWREVRAREALEKKQGELSKSLAETQSQRAIAEENFEAALAAVDRMLTRVGDRVLVQIPQMELVRRDLLDDALEFYETFLKKRGGESRLRIEVAQARLRVGDIHGLLAAYEKTREAYERAVSDLDALAADRPDEVTLRLSGVNARMKHSRVLRLLRSLDAADAEIDRALSNLAQADGATELQRRMLAANLWSERAQVRRDQGRLEESLAAHAEARLQLEELPRETHDREIRSMLMSSYARGGGTATLLASQGDPHGELIAAARQDFGAAIELAEELLAEREDVQIRANLAEILGDYGGSYIRAGNAADAAIWYRRAVEILEVLAEQFPSVVEYQSDLGTVLSTLGYALGELGQNDEALRALRRSVEIGERLLASHPDIESFDSLLGGRLGNLGWREIELGDVAEAQVHIERGLELSRAGQARSPQDKELKQTLAVALLMSVRVDLAQGRHGRAVERLDEALAVGIGPMEMPYHATYMVQASAACRADAALGETERSSIADRLLDQALGALIASVPRGLPGTVLLDPDLAPLRERPAWAELEQALAETSN